MSVLIDAQEYYRTLLSALRSARSNVIVLGWDIDTRLVLTPDANHAAERVTLERALREALQRNPRLVIHILCWDFAMIYSLERQLLPRFRRIFNHPRVHFALDGTHPFGASHHQKVVVIDDRLAFTGGLDLCVRRWDTRRHRAYDPRRRDSSQRGYHPFHDVQAVVSGEAAAWLGTLARERWERATGTRIPPTALGARSDARQDPWPAGLQPHFRDVPVALARTQPMQEGIREVREVERLFEDAILKARRTVYIEQQYLTSARIGELIGQRLDRPDCPEFVIVVPQVNSGWIEQRSMGVLRDRLVRALWDRDRHGKLRIVYPVAVTPSRKAVPISLHSKIMIVDDTLFRVGSANLSNRSMGLDTECDLAVHAEPGSAESRAIAAIRDSLLAEHLGCAEREVDETFRATGSLFAVLDRAGRSGGRDRELRPFRLTTPELVDAVTPSAGVLDPTEPVDMDPYFERFLPLGRVAMLERKVLGFGLRMGASLVAALAVAAWREWKAPAGGERKIERLARAARDHESGMPAAAAALAAAGALKGQPEAMIFGACLTYGPVAGAALSSGALLAAVGAGFAAGAADPERRASLARPGGFLPSYLVHASMAARASVAGHTAGRMGAPLAQTVLGAAAGQGIRIASLGLHAALFRAFVRRPRPARFAALAGSAVARYLAFRWLMGRMFPMHKKRSRPT